MLEVDTNNTWEPVYGYSISYLHHGATATEWKHVLTGSFISVPAVTVFNMQFDKEIGSSQKLVAEIIRGGVVIGRSVLTRNNGGKSAPLIDWGWKQFDSFQDWYDGNKWQEGDVIAFMIVDSSRDIDQFKVS